MPAWNEPAVGEPTPTPDGPPSRDDGFGLIEWLPDGIVLVDEDGRIAACNRQLEELTGWSRAEMVGRLLEVLVPVSRRNEHARLHEAYRAAPRVRPMAPGLQLELQARDGRLVPVEISLAPVVLAGRLRTVASIRDVSAARALEQDRVRLLEVLRLDPDAVYVLDARSERIDYANDAARSMLGLLPDEPSADHRLGAFAAPNSVDAHASIVAALRNLPIGTCRSGALERRSTDGTVTPVDVLARRVAIDGDTQLVFVERDARARLAQEATVQRQAAANALVTRITTEVLADAPLSHVYQLVVEEVARLFGSQNVSLVLEQRPTGELATVAAVGPAAMLHRTGQVQLNPAVIHHLMHADGPLALDAPPAEQPEALRRAAGPGAVAPFPTAKPAPGLLSVFRAPAEPPFRPEEVALLGDLARQLATVVELALARSDQQRLATLEERQRIARDLHDNVIQDVIRAGMHLAGEQRATADERARQRLDPIIDELEEVVRRLRTIVFDIHSSRVGDLRTRLQAAVDQAARLLPAAPHLTIVGAIELLPDAVGEHLLAAVREGLSNVARHTRSSSTAVAIHITPQDVTLTIDDDGDAALAHTTGGTGLESLAERAALCGGHAALTKRADGGSRLSWTARLG
ncbi:MAG: PAS domain S-box protein [Acidimicrobiia bacterium]